MYQFDMSKFNFLMTIFCSNEWIDPDPQQSLQSSHCLVWANVAYLSGHPCRQVPDRAGSPLFRHPRAALEEAVGALCPQ